MALPSRLLAVFLMLAPLPASAQQVAFAGLRADTAAAVEVSADSLTVNQADGTAVFTGNVVIHQDRGSLNGERVVYNLKTGQLQSGGEGGGRVKMRILPKGAP